MTVTTVDYSYMVEVDPKGCRGDDNAILLPNMQSSKRRRCGQVALQRFAVSGVGAHAFDLVKHVADAIIRDRYTS